MTMMTFLTDSPESCGIVKVDDMGVVTRFHEKVVDPPGNLTSGAVYILEPEVVNHVGLLNSRFVDFSTGVVPHFGGCIFTWRNTGVHRGVGTIASWQAAQAERVAE